jgi:hypothetical protein
MGALDTMVAASLFEGGTARSVGASGPCAGVLPELAAPEPGLTGGTATTVASESLTAAA